MTHNPLPPFAVTSGPRDARLVIVGEAFGHSEAQLRQPFVGASGQELFCMLGEAMPGLVNETYWRAIEAQKYDLAWVKPRNVWLTDASILMTNVFAFQPPANDIESLCAKKADVGGDAYTLPHIKQGKYVRPEFLGELDRLYAELTAVKPNLVLALGNTATWALLHATNIGSIRGTVAMSPITSQKVIGTYHPAGVLRNWSWRPIVIADLMKAAREMQFPEVRKPKRQIRVNPSLAECQVWASSVLAEPPPLLGVDCETMFGQIEMISFARSRSDALVIPFIDKSKPAWSYWQTEREEIAAWACVAALLESRIPKCFQNGMYDLQYILPTGIRPRALDEDTMLLHHSLFPEMLKGLGFMGSIYTSEVSWKLMRKKKPDSEKRDE